MLELSRRLRAMERDAVQNRRGPRGVHGFGQILVPANQASAYREFFFCRRKYTRSLQRVRRAICPGRRVARAGELARSRPIAKNGKGHRRGLRCSRGGGPHCRVRFTNISGKLAMIGLHTGTPRHRLLGRSPFRVGVNGGGREHVETSRYAIFCVSIQARRDIDNRDFTAELLFRLPCSMPAAPGAIETRRLQARNRIPAS